MAVQWWRIKKAYLSGVSYKELAEKYGLSVKTIQNRASKEGWPKEKGRIREEVGNELRAQVVRTRVKQLEKLAEANELFIDGLLSIAKQIRDKPGSQLKDKTRSLKNAESVAKAIQTAMLTQRDLFRIANIDQELAGKKFALEKKKWEAEQLEKAKTAETAGGTVWTVEQLDEGADVDG